MAFYLSFLFVLSALVNPHTNKVDEEICLNEKEINLHKLLNNYRTDNNLAPVEVSSKLTKVAQAHAIDLEDNYEMDDDCNPHSWSSEGDWTSCCYTNDHKNATCMWYKPKEIANYGAHGYEIIFYHSREATPEDALSGWQESSAHNPVVINTGIWKKIDWKAMGVAIRGSWAVVWFGPAPDPSPKPDLCQ
ncbi:CAP domain-containing protein [Mangrovivirga sp. M17]|uniref:CAP domain-containing protein n=1 Tax=Mangrovivirga halotolerans TaxID=2993936 RepID=A0ABT3RRL1_9BACT|nr:CAP domain-containing protein [Mangrovivirga halotolerans]MCX2744425.1 CAP domain-containing protein [Mangrovivirga halotolerans]